MRSSRRRALSAAHARFEEALVRERDPVLAGKARARGRHRMSDGVRERVLQEALPLIPQSGFNDATLKAAAEKAGVGPAEWKAAFPNGAASLAEAFSHWADAEMEEKMRSNQAERMRDRVAAAVRARIEVLVPHKEATRRAAAFLALPQHAPLAATLMMRSVDEMWRAAGDRSSDFSSYTKRGLLSGVC